MNQTTKYGLFFLGGVVLGALGAVESVREDFDDAVAEAQVKSQEKRLFGRNGVFQSQGLVRNLPLFLRGC